jgi:hypothetical protein
MPTNKKVFGLLLALGHLQFKVFKNTKNKHLHQSSKISFFRSQKL